jgi:integrase
MLKATADEIKLALMLALWTGQRRGDLLRLPWAAYDGSHIRLRQSRTGRRIVMPGGDAAQGTARHDHTSRPPHPDQLLRPPPGRPMGSGHHGPKRAIARQSAALRFTIFWGTAVVRLAIAGATVPQIATFTGHSLKDVEAILDAHYLGRDIQLAGAAVLKLEARTKLSAVNG